MIDIIQRVNRPIQIHNILFFEAKDAIEYLKTLEGRNSEIILLSTEHLSLFKENPFLKDWVEGGSIDV